MVRFALALLLTLVALATVLAQKEQTSRTGSTYVHVDMYATRDGQPIDDLTREEVEVSEDGVAQTIDTFEHVQVGPAGTQGSRARVFVVFLDTYHTQIEESRSARLPLIRFLDRAIGADDLVAVMTPEMSAGEMTFGKKAIVISNIMQNDWTWGRRGRVDRKDPKEELYDACYPDSPKGPAGPASDMKMRRREKLTFDAFDDLLEHLEGTRDERIAVLTVSDGWVLFKPDKALVSSGRGQADTGLVDRIIRRPPQKADDGKSSGGPQGVNRVECESDRVGLSTLDHSMALRSLTEEANRDNITFYPIYARGLLTSSVVSDASGKGRDNSNLASRQDSLRFLAENTDGLAVMSASSVDASIPKIIDDVSSYYLIGYSSSNTKLDGRYRAITVRVKRDGAKVRARRGYRGRTADDLVSATNGSHTNEGVSAVAAVANTNPRAPFKIRASSWVRETAAGTPRGSFWVVGELDYQTRRQLAWTAGAQADIVVLAADGTEVLSRTVDMNTADGPLAVQVPETGGVAPGEYAVKVNLRSQADDALALTDVARVEVKAGTTLGEAVLWRRGPSTGPQYQRTADPRFQRADRLRLELATTSPGKATARLLDRNGNALPVPAQVSERPDSSATFTWIVVDALLAPFANGDYAVEVTQGDAKQVTGFRVVP
ncbi:MAG TPA: VWA domain-containing protein [Vicinamibacterales bacterium]